MKIKILMKILEIVSWIVLPISIIIVLVGFIFQTISGWFEQGRQLNDVLATYFEYYQKNKG